MFVCCIVLQKIVVHITEKFNEQNYLIALTLLVCKRVCAYWVVCRQQKNVKYTGASSQLRSNLMEDHVINF